MLSIRWRLTIYHTLAILGITAVLLGIMAVIAIRGVKSDVNESTRARAIAATRLLESGAPPTDDTIAEFAEGNVFVVVRDGEGTILAQTSNRAPGLDVIEDDVRQAIWRDVLATGQPVTRSPAELHVYAMPIETDRSSARVVEAWKSYDETGQNIVPYNQIVVRAFPVVVLLAIAGSYLLARSALSPVDAIVRTAREISDRDLSRRLPVRRAHDELGRLATTFNDLLARLDVAFRQRDETLAQQRRFVADASHELRTPLTSIQGYARMLNQWALDDPATARESVAAIEREAARMSQLVENLLHLARGDEMAATDLDVGEHDLNEVVTAAVAAARGSANGRVTLIDQLFPIPVMATFDRARIQQITTILLDNAIKFTPPGGTVTISTRTTLDGVDLTVADTGPGIAPEDLPHIFERFYRADQSRPTGGTGLGLAIAQQIADRHGGTIRVRSEPGQGATFILTLPVERSA